jgi:hypothetical protein
MKENGALGFTSQKERQREREIVFWLKPVPLYFFGVV